jgi:DUF1680 family protein
VSADESTPGFLSFPVKSSSSVTMTFSLPVRLLASNPLTGQDTLTVTRGPITYVAESIDNPSLDKSHPHFQGIGFPESATFSERKLDILGFEVVALETDQEVYALEQLSEKSAHFLVGGKKPARSWKKTGEKVTLVPWFARANRGGAGRVRVSMMRVDKA